MKTILVADDHPLNRQLLVYLLGSQGYRVIETTDGLEAMEVAQAIGPDLIITDVEMPHLDGFEWIRRLRAVSGRAEIPVIFYTAAYDGREKDVQALKQESGAVYYLAKPAEAQVILKTVTSAFAEKP